MHHLGFSLYSYSTLAYKKTQRPLLPCHCKPDIYNKNCMYMSKKMQYAKTIKKTL